MNESNLHGYQRRAKEHVLANTHCALLMEMGLGKTVSTLTSIQYLMFEDFSIDSTLIVAPKRVVESVWDAEAAKWDHLKHLTFSKIHGSEKQRILALKKKAHIYLVSRDNIRWLCGQFGGSMLPFQMLVIDESSSFKNPKSQRFKALKKVQPSFDRIVELTGTFAPNGLIDIWSQIYLLDRGERLGKFIGKFRKKYFSPGGRNGEIVFNYDINEGADKIIYNLIGDICMSMKAKDYLTLPKCIDNVIDINFPKNLQEQYNEFEREKVLEFFAENEHETITAANAAGLSNKLLQFSNGAVYDEDKNYHVVHDLKIEAAKEVVEALNGKPLIIFYAYKSDKERLHQALKAYKPVDLKTNQNILDWNVGKIQVMMMHPASGGHGLNLQDGGHHLLWYGLTWSLELYQQAIARLYRQGQKYLVTNSILAAPSTIDKRVLRSLQSKGENQDSLMEAVKALKKKYLK